MTRPIFEHFPTLQLAHALSTLWATSITGFVLNLCTPFANTSVPPYPSTPLRLPLLLADEPHRHWHRSDSGVGSHSNRSPALMAAQPAVSAFGSGGFGFLVRASVTLIHYAHFLSSGTRRVHYDCSCSLPPSLLLGCFIVFNHFSVA